MDSGGELRTLASRAESQYQLTREFISGQSRSDEDDKVSLVIGCGGGGGQLF